MLDGIMKFLYFLGIDPIWPIVLVVALFLECLYPWRLEGKTKRTKDKDGNDVIYYYRRKDK